MLYENSLQTGSIVSEVGLRSKFQTSFKSKILKWLGLRKRLIQISANFIDVGAIYFPLVFFLHIKHLHSNIKPIVTRHIHILICLEKKQLQTKKDKTRAVLSYM